MLIIRSLIMLLVAIVVVYYITLIIQLLTGAKLLTNWISKRKIWIPLYYFFKD